LSSRATTKPPASNACFVTTHWSVVLSAGGGDSTRAGDCLAKLCQTYWYPLYAYVRQRGHSPHDAQDFTQGFFAHLLQKNGLARITRDKGKFRSFLLTALNHFLVDEWKRAKALKRGALKIIPLEAECAETRYRLEPVETATAESIFEQNWALALLEEVFQQLRREYESAGKGNFFDQLKFCLTGERSAVPYAELSARLKLSESALKVTVHRLRQRYRELLRAEVANTVSCPEEVEEELRHLFRALAR
jgi:RNA polymerase sigma factor (sigma-70 family)